MTDISTQNSVRQSAMKPKTSRVGDNPSLRKKRYAAELRFKYLGLGAVLIACLLLMVLLSTVLGKGIAAFTQYYINTPVNLVDHVDKNSPQSADYNVIYKEGIRNLFPFMSGRKQKRTTRKIFSTGSSITLQETVTRNIDQIGTIKSVYLPADDFADLYLKNLIATKQRFSIDAGLTLQDQLDISRLTHNDKTAFDALLAGFKSSLDKQADIISRDIRARDLEINQRVATGESPDSDRIKLLFQEIAEFTRNLASLKLRQSDLDTPETLNRATPSILVVVNGGIIKIEKIGRDFVEGQTVVPMKGPELRPKSTARAYYIDTPEESRKISDVEIALIEHLKARGLIESRFNWDFLSRGASREPEQAGIWGAVIGSFLTMLVTLTLAFPLGILTAIYLEEFAPKNLLTDIIEVNISNLAAVPSIIFGLLGLAVFLNWFGMPRSAPLVGGIVLALMTLPTIIIASRAAIKAVPPSIREAALGVGASKMQTVFHHVLPLAMPGMLTGTIIGMAQALGETAPLLMIGMVAFIVDIPTTFSDPATVMPVQIFMWADFPEPGFQQKTAAAIMILLAFLIAMNAIAVFLRKRFERRW